MQSTEPATAELATALDAELAALWRASGRGGAQVAGVSRTTASVLATLRDDGPRRVTALALAESVAQPTMTSLVIRLERDGLVVRNPDPDDARAVRVAITSDGRARIDALRARRTELMRARLEALEPEHREALAAAVPALHALVLTGVEQP